MIAKLLSSNRIETEAQKLNSVCKVTQLWNRRKGISNFSTNGLALATMINCQKVFSTLLNIVGFH